MGLTTVQRYCAACDRQEIDQMEWSLSFPRIYLPNGNLVKFSQTNRRYFCRRPNRKSNSENRKQKPPKPFLPLARHGPPYNTPKSRPTPRTTTNRRTNDSCTFAQLRCKLPIGYNRAPTFASKTAAFRELIPKLRSAVLPQCTGQTDAHTNQQSDDAA